MFRYSSHEALRNSSSEDTPFIDLTTAQKIRFEAEEDRAAFGSSRSYRNLFKKQVYKLKQDDENFRMLSVQRENLSEAVCDRIGFYLWRSSHIKNVTLDGCCLSEEKMKKLFSRIVDQHEQNESNDYLKNHDILEKIFNVGDTSLTGRIMGYLALNPFATLLHVNLSYNTFGTKGLGVLVRAMANAPTIELHLTSCGLDDLSPFILGGRKLKNLKLLYLDSNHFHSTPANAKALSVLFDGGHPRQRELSLKGCGIDSELIEKSAPALSSNRKMKCLRLFENPLGDRGTAALIAAICDSTSFEKMLASNHTIAKVMVDHDQVHGLSVLEKMLRLLLWINLTNQFRSTLRGRSEIACRKLFTIVAYDVNIDPSMFLHFDIGLAPQIFFKIQDVSHPQEEKENLTAIYKILKCKEFHARLKLSSQTSRLQIDHDVLRKKEEETRMKNEQLEADNAALSEENRILKEQIASLMAQNGVDACTMANSVGSIAERVKTRAKRRKLGRM